MYIHLIGFLLKLDEVFACSKPFVLLKYIRSSPFDHSRKRPAQVTTTFVKPRLNCDFNFVVKSSGK